MEINKAVLLVNLGTPEQPTPGAVSVFLTKFLSDPRVVEAPRWIWWFVLRCIVIPLRKRRVAAAYQSIWTDEGSPLRVISEKQRIALQQSLQDRGVTADVFTAETYGGEPLGEAIKRISERGYQRTLLIPMYPQYSGSTTGAIYDQVAKLTQNSRDIPDVRIIKDFHDNPLYIEALAESIVEFRAAHGENRKLLMSFHGVPKDYVDKGDPYYHQCKRTAQLVADRMQLPEDAWDFCFQSRFGPKEWLQPYTDVYLTELAKKADASVDIVSPAFVADCLETLEELNVENRHLFLSEGGTAYNYIPCLNHRPAFIECLATMVEAEI